jgi:hypothetical protein
MGATKKLTSCSKHPDRPAVARGLCHSCYNTKHKYNRGQNAPCHPGRKIYDGERGLCESCYHKWLRENEPRYKELERLRYQRTKELKKAQRRKREYGISPDETNRILELQGGLCAICKESPATHLDHDHKTGVVRGFLCDRCNRGLGYFRDNLEFILNAGIYLENRRR